MKELLKNILTSYFKFVDIFLKELVIELPK